MREGGDSQFGEALLGPGEVATHDAHVVNICCMNSYYVGAYCGAEFAN